MIYPEDLTLAPTPVKRLLKLSRAFQIMAKWFLNLQHYVQIEGEGKREWTGNRNDLL